MKKKRIKISVATTVIALSTVVFGGSINTMASNSVNYKDMTEYAAYD